MYYSCLIETTVKIGQDRADYSIQQQQVRKALGWSVTVNSKHGIMA
jgi:hypothetical protein